ncbi:hypothetical protein [Agrobacterium sp. NPDC090283]|uniref:hypothetical protein n=1 Tax=Agrobacterium sp. NPDC090283 TaxID=3363920 RepID=UPI00383BB955
MTNTTLAKSIVRIIVSGLMASLVMSTSVGAENSKQFNTRVGDIVAEATAKKTTVEMCANEFGVVAARVKGAEILSTNVMPQAATAKSWHWKTFSPRT